MAFETIISIVIRKWRDIAVCAVVFGMLTLFFTVATTKRYHVQTDYLLVQNGINYRDLYSLSKSAEYAGNVLTDAMFSQLFIDEVARTGFFNVAALPEDPKERLAAWGRMISVQKNFQSNILSVSVSDDSRDTALSLAQAISGVLTERNSIFRTGTPDSITIKVLSGPISEKNPSAALLAALTALGAIIGGGFVVTTAAIQEMRARAQAMSAVEDLGNLSAIP